MARTPSNMLPLETQAPDFQLIDTTDFKLKSLNDLKGDKGTLIMFICNHCPFVKHVNNELSNLAKDYLSNGINCIAISSNDIVNYPEDAPNLMQKLISEEGFIFPYLYDETQQVARAYDAACTPDFFLFDHQLKLVYRGQLDDSRPGNNIPVTGKDIRMAIDQLVHKKPPLAIQKPSIGCNIKWASSGI